MLVLYQQALAGVSAILFIIKQLYKMLAINKLYTSLTLK